MDRTQPRRPKGRAASFEIGDATALSQAAARPIRMIQRNGSFSRVLLTSMHEQPPSCSLPIPITAAASRLAADSHSPLALTAGAIHSPCPAHRDVALPLSRHSPGCGMESGRVSPPFLSL